MRIVIILSSIILMCLLSGCSDSDSDNGTEPVSVPDTPLGLTVTATGLTSLTLSWDVTDGATEYDLLRSESASGIYAEVYSGAAAGFVDNGLPYSTTYYYKVVAENSGGESDPSDAVNGTTDEPDGFIVTGSPSGGVDYTYNYFTELNGYPQYRSNPIGLNIIVPSGGDQAGLWVINDQIEGINLFYHPTASDYPSTTGWLTVSGDAATSILLTAF